MESSDRAWRHSNIGRILNNAVRRFEERVLEILAEGGNAPTRLSHLSLTRHLDLAGTRVTELARRAAMTKQAMSELVVQCEALGIVSRAEDPTDKRAKVVRFTARGLHWLEAFHQAITGAEEEMRTELGRLKVDGLMKTLKSYGSSAGTLRS